MTQKDAVVALALALTVMVAAMIGATAGYLARRDGASYQTALTRSAATFAATLMLAAAVTGALVALGGR